MVIGKNRDVFRGIFFWIGKGLRGGVTWEDLSMEELLMEEETFNGGAQDFLALFKKTMKK